MSFYLHARPKLSRPNLASDNRMRLGPEIKARFEWCMPVVVGPIFQKIKIRWTPVYKKYLEDRYICPVDILYKQLYMGLYRDLSCALIPKNRWFYIWCKHVHRLELHFFFNFCAAHLSVWLDIETKFPYFLFLTRLSQKRNQEFHHHLDEKREAL